MSDSNFHSFMGHIWYLDPDGGPRLNRYGHRAEGRAKVSLIENSISARYVIPGIYPNTWLTTFHVGFQQLDPQTSSSSRFVTGASAGHDRRGWRETFSLNYEIEAFTVGVDEGTSRLLMPQGDWTRLWSRDPIFTRRGARVRVNMFGSHEAVASTARFFQIKVEGKLIREPARRTRVILRGEVGRTITGKFRELPPTIRFFAGGDQSVRGFAFRTLSPKDEDGNPIGGPVLVVMSGELEYRFFEKWGVAAFYDAGNAFNEDLIGSPEALERAVGGGVRWLSPIGMFRADVGFPISAPEFDPWRFHLTIGPDL